MALMAEAHRVMHEPTAASTLVKMLDASDCRPLGCSTAKFVETHRPTIQLERYVQLLSGEWAGESSPARRATEPAAAGVKLSQSSAAQANASVAAHERKVRNQVGPEAGPTPAFYSCVLTGMRGPTCTFWANLTPSCVAQLGRRALPRARERELQARQL